MTLCTELARPQQGNGSWAANNGTIIEQAQILTTHNLAVLFSELELARELDLPDLARRAFEWVWRSMANDARAPRLKVLKNCAYAWRQMIFYLSLSPSDDVTSFVDWAHGKVSSLGVTLRHFVPAVTGLHAIAAGHRFGPDGVHAESGAGALSVGPSGVTGSCRRATRNGRAER